MTCDILTNHVLAWMNTLDRDHPLSEEIIEHYFADPFSMRVNGDFYEAVSLDAHLSNMIMYQRNIVSIKHKLIEGYYRETSSVSVLSLKVIRDNMTTFADMMLRLRFNDEGKVTLWHQLFYHIS